MAAEQPKSEVPEADAPYRRTLRLAVSVATQLALPGRRLVGGHTVGEGYYYELEGSEVTADDLASVTKLFEELIAADEKVTRTSRPWKEVVDYFEANCQPWAKALVESRTSATVAMISCRDVLRLELGPTCSSLGCLAARRCRLEASAPGFIATYTVDTYEPQPALLGAHEEHKAFGKSYSIQSVGQLNTVRQVARGRKNFVLSSEFRQEGKLAEIASMIKNRKDDGKAVRIICIAGPTSSGKTTFANKLCMYLMNAGFCARPLTVDHYYLPLDRQPRYQARKQRSDVDYDHIESMDVELVSEHLKLLASGESVVTPVYNMKTGFRDEPGHKFEALPDNGILVIEGIHALNPTYTAAVPPEQVFKIFISPLTALQLDDFNCVKTTDHRLLRRMSRDYLFRGNSASTTLKMWDNVRRGEGVWIFPHQNDADFVLNSAAEYEIPVLKTFVEPLLRAVTPEDPNFEKAAEVLELLDKFGTWPPEIVPPAALLREFIGDGDFDCH